MVSPESPNGAVATQEAPQVTAPEVAQTTTATATTAPEVDYKARTEQLEAEKSDLQHKLESAMGRVKTNVPDQTLREIKDALAENSLEVRKLRLESDIDKSPAEKQFEQQKIAAEERSLAVNRDFEEYAQERGDDLQERLGVNSWLLSEPSLRPLFEQWNNSSTKAEVRENYRTLSKAIDKTIDNKATAREKAADEKVETERKRANQANGTLEVGAPQSGTPSTPLASATRDNIDKLYMDWERAHPDDPNPYADKYRTFISTGAF